MRCQFTLRILWKTGAFELYVAVPAAEAIKEMMAIAIGSYAPLCVPQADTNKPYLTRLAVALAPASSLPF